MSFDVEKAEKKITGKRMYWAYMWERARELIVGLEY